MGEVLITDRMLRLHTHQGGRGEVDDGLERRCPKPVRAVVLGSGTSEAAIVTG